LRGIPRATAATLALQADRAATSLDQFPNRGRHVGEYHDPSVRELFVRCADYAASLDSASNSVIALPSVRRYSREMFDSSTRADARLLTALGSVTIDFSMLEAALQLAISLMLMPSDTRDLASAMNAAERNMILTCEMTFKQRVYAFASLFRQRWPLDAESDDFVQMCGQLHACENRRNQLVHSSYTTADEGVTTRRKATAKTKRGFRWQVDTANVDDIEGFAESLRRLSHGVQHEVIIRVTPPDVLAALRRTK
jgi:hypothetical protein